MLRLNSAGDDKGKPYVLPSVKSAEEKVVSSKLDKEYAGKRKPLTCVLPGTKCIVRNYWSPFLH